MAEPLISEKPQTISIYNLNKKIAPSSFLFVISFSLVSFSVLCFSFKDTKFWFFFSNAIIIFVAADSGAFSSSKPKPDLYDEYLRYSKSRNACSTTYAVSQSQESRREEDKETQTVEEKLAETEEERYAPFNPGKAIAIVADGTELQGPETENVCQKVVEKSPNDEKYSRSKSEKAIVVVANKRKLQRSKTDDVGWTSEDSDDLSAMSDEELNRRVEEFINRFNREIRLQEMRERNEVASIVKV